MSLPTQPSSRAVGGRLAVVCLAVVALSIVVGCRPEFESKDETDTVIVDVTQAGDVIRAADIVVMQLETPLETVLTAAKIARSAQVPVILNPAPAQPLEDELLRNVTLLTPNESEAELLTGIRVEGTSGVEEAAEALLAKGLETIVLTLGARGVFVATAEVREWVPGFQVDPVDTTAAGDSFNAGYLAARFGGAGSEDAAKNGSRLAATVVQHRGAIIPREAMQLEP